MNTINKNLSVADVALQLGVPEGTARGWCPEWAAKGLARQEATEGGKPYWVIDRKAMDDSALKLRQLTAAQREENGRRLDLVQQWDQAKRAAIREGKTNEEGSRRFIARMAAEGVQISAITLYRWYKQHRRTGLCLDGRWGCRSNPVAKANEPMLREARRLWMTQNKLSVQVCFELAGAEADKQGWRRCSYDAVRRYLKKIPKAHRVLAREGPKAFTAKAEPYIERDYSVLESNEIWNADHHQLDVIVQIGERPDPTTGEVLPVYARPWLTAWQDLRSRKIVGWVIRATSPSTDTILEAFRQAALAHGLPQRVYTDNGRDFLAQVFTGITRQQHWARRSVRVEVDQERLAGIYAQLNIGHIHAWPYHGQSKPIERFFGTMEGRFGRTFATYCGRNTVEKPEQLGVKIDQGWAPTLGEIVEAFGKWLEADYHERTHTGDAMDCTPNQAFAANLKTRRVASDETLNVLLQRRIGPLKVGRNGVRYNRLGYGYSDLGGYLGQEVYIRVDDRDLTHVSVWSLQDRFLLEAKSNDRLPANADAAELRSAIAEKRREVKARKAAVEGNRRRYDSLTDRLLRMRAEKAAARPAESDPPPPPNIKLVRSPVEDSMPALQRAQQFRKKAVGDGTPHPGFQYPGMNRDDGSTGGFTYQQMLDVLEADHDAREVERQQQRREIPTLAQLNGGE